MKKLFSILTLLALSACSTVQQPPSDPRLWANVTDPTTNHVVAGVDLQTGKVNYYESSDKAVMALLRQLVNIDQNYSCTLKPKEESKAKAPEQKKADSKKKESK